MSAVIQRELNDPRLGMVTVLRVEPTDDLREVKIHYSVLGSASVKSRTVHAIESATGYIQREVGKSLDIRNTPRLKFVLDETQERLSRFEDLVQRVAQEEREDVNGEETE